MEEVVVGEEEVGEEGGGEKVGEEGWGRKEGRDEKKRTNQQELPLVRRHN